MRRGLLLGAVAVLLVALGIALGAGPLQLSKSHQERDLERERATTARLQREADVRRDEAGFADAYARATAPALLSGRLAGRTVAVVTLPGADPETVTALRADVDAAGGRITSAIALSPKASSAGGRQLVDALTSQMVTQVPQLRVPADASGFDRLGALLGRAVGAPEPAGAAYDDQAVAIVSGLETAEMITVTEPASGPIPGRAGVVLVVAGPPARSADSADAAAENTVPLAILRALAGQVPVVVSGTTAAAGALGLVGAVRADGAAAAVLTTTDGVQTAMGEVVAVRALAARGSGTIGHYGGDAPDGALPPG